VIHRFHGHGVGTVIRSQECYLVTFTNHHQK
jgi:hypothetical protein